MIPPLEQGDPSILSNKKGLKRSCLNSPPFLAPRQGQRGPTPATEAPRNPTLAAMRARVQAASQVRYEDGS